MTPNLATVETILGRGGVWRNRDFQQKAIDITGDSEKRNRIGGFLDKLMKLGKVERVATLTTGSKETAPMINRRRSLFLLTAAFLAVLGVRTKAKPLDPDVILKIRRELDRRFKEMDAPHILSPMEKRLRRFDALQIRNPGDSGYRT
jgi:hypothetical protein